MDISTVPNLMMASTALPLTDSQKWWGNGLWNQQFPKQNKICIKADEKAICRGKFFKPQINYLVLYL